MKEKNISKRRKIAYICLSVALVLVIGAVTTFLFITPSDIKDTAGKTPTQSTKPDDGQSTPADSTDPGQAELPDDPVDDNPGDEPVVEIITFAAPVIGGVSIKDYTEQTLVYSSTLGVYTGHLGIDFQGVDGAQVVAVYDGEIESITTNYLTGTTVTIDHGNGLKTVYNSIEPSETIDVGQKVQKGQLIGVISTNNKQEYKDGAHLHFEVSENGITISPLKYLTVEEK